ncbi:hypothetical protein JOE21_002119 [Desmospora profundinema]|uniref:Secreted protein n=1 Tax=Desmospora profundinema TaxID=1571184 RepID=A0ABU1INY2_9BACL|nr:hypothetical protein [Desmospora profundinema]
MLHHLVPHLPILIVFMWREAWFFGGVDSATHGAKTENQADRLVRVKAMKNRSKLPEGALVMKKVTRLGLANRGRVTRCDT